MLILVDHEVEISRLIPPLASLLGSKAPSAQTGSGKTTKDLDAASQQLEVLRAMLLLLQLPLVHMQNALFHKSSYAEYTTC